jgi:integrase
MGKCPPIRWRPMVRGPPGHPEEGPHSLAERGEGGPSRRQRSCREGEALALEMMFLLGLRVGEVAGLQARDVDRERREITVARTVSDVAGRLVVKDSTKTGRSRTIPVPGVLWERLEAYVKQT